MNKKTLLPGLIFAAITAGASAQQPPEIPAFSKMTPGAPPQGWKPFQLAATKKSTEYTLVNEDGVVALRAVAHGAASAMEFKTTFDPHKFPMISFKWEVHQGIPSANNADVNKEDSPVRVMIGFDGDTSKLGLKDKFASSLAQTASGQALPYATLMYIWGNKVPLDSITVSGRTSRIRMLAVNVDDKGIGKWQSHTRNMVEDFKRAFGEEPGNVISIQLLTDTDNTGEDCMAFYGDISVGPPK